MSSSSIVAQSATPAPEHFGAADVQFSEALPYLLLSLLERRYLTSIDADLWSIAPRPHDSARPLLCEITGLGRADRREGWGDAMPAVLNACHDPGHALISVLHGQGDRHRLYVGGRRLIGAAARSTEDYLTGLLGAFKANFAGLLAEPFAALDEQPLAHLAFALQTAPSLVAITGIPSKRGGSALDLRGLDRLVGAVGEQHYTLMVVAEPLDAVQLDAALDACRRLRSEVHAYTRRTISRSSGGSESESRGVSETVGDWKSSLPTMLRAVAQFSAGFGALRVAGNVARGAGVVGFLGNPMLGAALSGLSLLSSATFSERGDSVQKSTSTSWQESGGMELLNANAEACEMLLQQHIERLQRARSSGWWRTAVYIAAESDAVAQTVAGAVRSLCSGEATALDPLRVIPLNDAGQREALLRGQILDLLPAGGQEGHPLGSAFDALATCLTSEEVGVLVNFPTREIPGIPMRDVADFAMTVPPAEDRAITLGEVVDSQDHTFGKVTLTPTMLNRHVFVTGMPGYGKTNTCIQLTLEAYQQLGIPFLVIEPAKAEYRRLARLPELRGKFNVYTIGEGSSLPFRLNPLSPVPGVPLGRHIDLIKAAFNASFPMFAGMSFVLEEAILEVYTERGWSLYTSQNDVLDARPSLDETSALTPNLEDLYEKIEVVLARKNYGQEIQQNMGAALRSRLRSLMIGNKGLLLNTRRSIPLQHLFETPSVIELQNLGDDEEKAFVMTLLFVMLYEYAEHRQRQIPANRRGQLQHLTLIEEAHRLLQNVKASGNPEVGDPRAKAVAMFADMLAEMRALGEGFIIADQIPTKLAPETLKNSNLKIVHHLVYPDDRQVVGSCMNLNESQIRHLANLKPGMAVVHDERVGEAVLTRVYPVKATRALEAFDGEMPTGAEFGRNERVYLHRNAGCRSCPSPCDFYSRVSETTDIDLALQLYAPFLQSLLLHEDAAASWAAWERAAAQWRARSAIHRRARGGATEGASFCAITQAAYRWLGDVIAMRHRAVPSTALGGIRHEVADTRRELTPEERLQRERAARGVGRLIASWLAKPSLDEDGARLLVEVNRSLVAAIAPEPPEELVGCRDCPARCRFAHAIVPALPKVEKAVATALTRDLAMPARLDGVRRYASTNIPAYQLIREDDPAADGLLYCLAAHALETVPDPALRTEVLTSILRNDRPAGGESR